MNEFLLLAALMVLLLLNAILAAGGSALVSSHPGRLGQLEEEGLPLAGLARRLAEDSTQLILSLRVSQSALRLLAVGLAMASYARMASATAQAQIWGLLGALLVAWFAIAFLIFIAEHLVLRSPEGWAVRLSAAVAGVVYLFSPLVWILTKIANRLAGPLGLRQYPLVTEEQIMTLVDAGEEGGAIEKEEKEMIYSIFQLDDTLAREVMVPRIDMLAFDEHTSVVEATDTLLRTGYSRAPIYSESIDNVIGLVYIKDLLAAWRAGELEKPITEIARPAYFVPEAKKVDELLAEMQTRRVQMAIVVDEYGGTAGLATFEDIVEEIVGEVHDEYDIGEEVPFLKMSDGEFIFRGGIDLDDVNEITHAGLPKGTSETLGGFIYSQLGRVPSPGEVVEAGGMRMVVEQVIGRRIRTVRASLMDISAGEADAGNHEA